MRVAAHLERRYPEASGGPPSNASLFRLAPDGVCRATCVAAGPVSSYLAVSPLPRGPLRESVVVCFLWHFPRGRPHSPLASILPCGARTFLPCPSLAQTTPTNAWAAPTAQVWRPKTRQQAGNLRQGASVSSVRGCENRRIGEKQPLYTHCGCRRHWLAENRRCRRRHPRSRPSRPRRDRSLLARSRLGKSWEPMPSRLGPRP
jgi:hypothetical protein